MSGLLRAAEAVARAHARARACCAACACWWWRTRRLAGRALQRGLRAEGFAVDVAHDGPDGLAAGRATGDYDAVVLDVMLPRPVRATGWCRRCAPQGSWVPVLMLIAKDGEHDQADGLDVGADDYLTKPFSFVVLLARLRALLRRGAPQRPAVLTAGDLSLDPATPHGPCAGDARSS